MDRIVDFPLLVFAISLIALWLAAQIGNALGRRGRLLDEAARTDFDVIRTAIFTLLALIVGFTFSMAVNRYDQRKNLEEAEANAIGTEYIRVDLLPTPTAASVQGLLRRYLDLRLSFYRARDEAQLEQIDAETTKLENELWSEVKTPGEAQPTPLAALVVSGMNDVLNSQGYTQAAWWNRLPAEAWSLMAVVALCGNLLLGYGARRSHILLFLAFSLTVSTAFFLIADIDSPRKGVIRIAPQNLMSLSRSLSGG